MQNVSKLYSTVGRAVMQQVCPDSRNLSTFLTAVTCLIASKSVLISAWISWISGDTKAGSRIRRIMRWLDNSSIDPHTWHASIFSYAMQDWTKMPIFLALDTTMLYDRFCCVQISMIYMNRAIPLTWRVLEHNSSSVKYAQYAHLFDRAVELLPKEVEIFFWPTEVLYARI